MEIKLEDLHTLGDIKEDDSILDYQQDCNEVD